MAEGAGLDRLVVGGLDEVPAVVADRPALGAGDGVVGALVAVDSGGHLGEGVLLGRRLLGGGRRHRHGAELLDERRLVGGRERRRLRVVLGDRRLRRGPRQGAGLEQADDLAVGAVGLVLLDEQVHDAHSILLADR